MPAASIGQQNGPNSFPWQHQLHVIQPTLQTLNQLCYEVLPHPPYSSDLSPTDYHFFNYLDNFLHGKCFHNQQEAENAFQEFTESQGTDFYSIGIINLFLVGKNVLIVMVPTLINKAMFESSYNDLKITVRNHNYVSPNLIFSKDVKQALKKIWKGIQF